MSFIKNKNLLFLGAVISLAALYGYYTYNTTDDAPPADSTSGIVIETPAKTPVSNVVDPAEKIPVVNVPVVNVPAEATTDEVVPTPSVPQAEKTGTAPAVPVPEGE